MSNKPIDMFKIRQLLHFYADGKGSKFISKATGISRNSVKKYLLRFVAPGLTIEGVEAMSDRQLATGFLIIKPKIEGSRVTGRKHCCPNWGDKLKKRGITKQMVYAPYISQCPGGYKPSAFLVPLNIYVGMSKPSMRVAHKVSDGLFIDFTGQKLQVVDQDSSEVGAARLTNGCKRADSFSVYNFSIIEGILKSKADFIALDEQQPASNQGNAMPLDDNIRGEDYYQVSREPNHS